MTLGADILGADASGADVVIPVELVTKKILSAIRFVCTITGTADSLSDVVIPISSLSGSLTVTGVNSLLVVCPDGSTFGADIVARSNGGFIITTVEVYTDGTTANVDSEEYTFSGITSDRGSRNWSFSLRGKNTESPVLPFRYLATGISILTINADGKRRARADYLSNIRPGDTLTLLNDEEIICGVITYNINVASTFMTVTEA